MDFVFNGLPVTIIKSRRKTISVKVEPQELVVRAPAWLTKKETEAFLFKKRKWIEENHRLVLEREERLSKIPKFTQDEIKELAEKALAVIPERVKHYAPLVGVDYGRITIRNQKTRWGSCSSKGNLNFNCLLMLAPDEVTDSVVVHELCHRKHMDHSKAFYNEVLRVYPEYWTWHKWLDDNGSMLLKRLP